MRFILESAHDKGGHWGRKGTQVKLRDYVYWPDPSEDVARYIGGCIQCARHGPALRSQPLHPIHVIYPLQLLGMDWIGPLPITKSGIMYIFHVICYFSRYSFIFASPTANSKDVTWLLRILFVQYH